MKEKREKPGILRLFVSFIWTGHGFEDKERFYLILGATTIGLALVFGLTLIAGALFTLVRRL